MKRTAIFVAFAALLISGSAFAAAPIVIINNNVPGVGFNDPTPAAPIGGNPGTTVGEQRLNAFRHAAGIWGAKLDSRVEIRILAQFVNQTCTPTSATLGSAGAAYIIRDFPGAAPATWYSPALANKLAGIDLVPTVHDINANFNALLNGSPTCLGGRGWYYGYDANEGTNIDFVAVLLHEMGHGLGFQTFTSLSTGAFPSSAGVAFPDTYAIRLMNAATSKTYPQMTPLERVAASVNSRNLVWIGGRVTAGVPSVLAFGVPLLTVNSPASVAGKYSVGVAQFGAPLTSSGVTGSVVLGLDAANAAGPLTTDGCSPLTNDVSGKIALMDRGACLFVVKVKNAQNAGAIGVIIADIVAGSPPPDLGGADPTITISAVRITLADGNKLKPALPLSATIGRDMSARAGAHPLLQMAQMFAPNPAQPGSSVSHYDTIAFPNQLMEPSINSNLTHNVEPPFDLTLPLFRDIGWYLDRDLDLTDDEGADQCLASDLRPTINIGSCDTGIDSSFSSATGCTRTDLIAKLAAGARNHGDFVSGVTDLANQWKKSGAISGKQFADVVSCAAGSQLP